MAVGIYNEAQNFYTSALPGYYPGQTVAGLTNNQRAGYQTSINAYGNYIGTANNIANAYQRVANEAYDTGGVNQTTANQVNQIGASMNMFDNPHLDNAVNRMRSTARADFNRNINPYMQDMAIKNGMAGSSRAAMMDAITVSDFEKDLNNREADMRYKGYNTGLNAYMQDRQTNLNYINTFNNSARAAMNDYRSAAQMPVNAWNNYANSMLNYGNVQQDINQQRLNNNIARYDYGVNEAYNRLNQYNSMLQGMPGANAQNSTVTTGRNVDWGKIAAGAINSYDWDDSTSASAPINNGYNPMNDVYI